MKWSRLRIKTTVEAEDVIIAALYDIGLEGAQIEDHVPLTAREKEQMFVDIMPDAPEDDGIAYLSFFLEQEEGESGEEHELRLRNLVEQVKQELEDIGTYMDIGDGTIALSETEDKDWINNWKEFFHQFYIDDILVIPSWEKMDEADRGRLTLHIDPGTAFGTGMHETTQLCIRQLRRFVTPQTRILDVGTGSGILSILSLMFGAKEAVGTDLDPCAVNAVEDNKKNNGIEEGQFRLLIGNIITDPKIQDAVGIDSYDIVVANILADVLVPLTPVAARHLKSGGVYITSGIIDDKEDVVREAVVGTGLDILDVTYQGEWVCVTARKP